MKRFIFYASFALILSTMLCWGIESKAQTPSQPRIVNIINFIRLLEPRDPVNFSEDALFQTVEKQIADLKEKQLPATFLLQYDALITPRYQELLKTSLYAGSEVGGWWEITQPHVEAAGLKWRGRYPWDWHAHVGFSTGYTPEEREILVDVYMAKFKEIFGYYPKSVGSWFIDAHTLAYMYEKYGIVASCNCRDQYGTDGYTLWGGYWNQAYYPSRVNAYMPAQTKSGQIPVPIFRMLGSDPIYQYDTGLNRAQGVITLEPACSGAGDNQKWVEWYFRTMFTKPSLAFNYVHVGQENSFTWSKMRQGWNIQIPLVAQWRNEGRIRVETLSESGAWFKRNFPLTPATAVTAMLDQNDNPIGSLWYNSRFYRVNMMWVHNEFRFRDIHLFDERIESDYLKKAGTSNECRFMTMPVVDGYLWSTNAAWAGLRLVEVLPDGSSRQIKTGRPEIIENGSELVVKCNPSEGQFTIRCTEQELHISFITSLNWALELTVAQGKQPPFKQISERSIQAELNGHPYDINTIRGGFATAENSSYVVRITPSAGVITLDCNLSR
ncbi:MAG: hypothetical protein J6L75_00225 [Alistipes sp.]|nr:hypothetical protein [Alistipes sp.]